jgi:hypothetical protein
MSHPRLAVLLTILILPTLLLAQAQPPKPPAPKPPPFVVVTKTDGTQVKGQLASVDAKGISLRPITKGVPDENTIDVPWTEVKVTSNGLTRAKAIAANRTEHKDIICTDCAGEGMKTCATCKGTAHDPEALKDCATCKGELLVDCKAPKCDKGKIPCPAPCLKLTAGPWIMKPDGKRWKKVPVKGGYGDISENHLGELWEKNKDGEYVNRPCPTCEHTGLVNCPKCEGKGNTPCPTCSANDKAPACKDCDKGKKSCEVCKGAGVRR